MAANHLSYTLQVHDLLMGLKRILQPYGGMQQVASWIAELDRQNEKLERMRFQVAVVGEFKRGKTSLINALLRKEILPADVAPATATINRITYGDTPAGYVYWKDGRPAEKIRIDQLADYITKLTEHSASRAQEIKEAVVEYPCRFCENNVDLIDTPGMNDDDAMNSVTIDQLPEIDLAIVTLDPHFPVSDTEADFIARLTESNQVCQIVFMVNKMDTVATAQRERILRLIEERLQKKVREILLEDHSEQDDVMKKYDRIFARPILFPVSSVQALYACEMGDQELFEQSGFQRLNDELLPLIIRTQHSAAILTPLHTIQRLAPAFQTLIGDWERQTRQAEEWNALKKAFAETAYGMKMEQKEIWTACREVIARSKNERSREALDGFDKASHGFSERGAFISRMKTMFSELSAELPQEEYHTYYKIWEEHFCPDYRELKKRLSQLTEQTETLSRRIGQDLEDLDKFGALPQDLSTPEAFYWETAPVYPERMPLGKRAYHADQAIKESFESYYRRREQRLFEFVRFQVREREQRIEQLVRKFFNCASYTFDNGYERMEKQEYEKLCGQLDSLTAECQKTEESYSL